MRLLVQPADGIAPLVKAIEKAKHSVEILIFRFDQDQIEIALTNAVGRGVAVHALIAHVNSSGEESLRKLETRLLGAGVTVARTADGLARYHGKLMIVDRRELFVLAFNFTDHDIHQSRSFGVVTSNRKLVQEAAKLFEADSKRQPFIPVESTLVVSPENARKQLGAFIQGAKRELLIYDPKISDREMVRLLGERLEAGVDLKIIGQAPAKLKAVARGLAGMRLHTRCMIRDREMAFVGSQSLRELELDGRREVGMIFQNSAAVSHLVKIFDGDWEAATREAAPAMKVAKKVAKAVLKEVPPVTPMLKDIVKEMAGNGAKVEVKAEEVEETVKDAIKEAVKGVLEDVVKESVKVHPDA